VKTYGWKYKSWLGVEVVVNRDARSVAVRVVFLGGSVTLNLAASATGV
jgi:hypothetical protein